MTAVRTSETSVVYKTTRPNIPEVAFNAKIISASPLDPMLSHQNPSHILIVWSIKIHVKILTCMPRSPKWSVHAFMIYPMCMTRPAYLILIDIITVIILR
jgi:hypothetical protein